MNRKIPIWKPIVIALFILLSGFFSGNHFYKQLKKELQEQIEDNKLIIEQSQKTQDSLISIAAQERNYADRLRSDNEQLTRRNNSLYYQLKRRNAQVFIIDTTFISNARRISESSDRFYQRNDTIR